MGQFTTLTLPSRYREPSTRSASPRRIGATIRGISSGSYWPSGCSITTTSASGSNSGSWWMHNCAGPSPCAVRTCTLSMPSRPCRSSIRRPICPAVRMTMMWSAPCQAGSRCRRTGWCWCGWASRSRTARGCSGPAPCCCGSSARTWPSWRSSSRSPEMPRAYSFACRELARSDAKAAMSAPAAKALSPAPRTTTQRTESSASSACATSPPIGPISRTSTLASRIRARNRLGQPQYRRRKFTGTPMTPLRHAAGTWPLQPHAR